MTAREEFDHVVASGTAALSGDEVLLVSFNGEDSDFVRFNGAAVRQAGAVHQRSAGLELVRGRRHASASLALSGDRRLDEARTREVVADLREVLDVVPDDPYLLYNEGEETSSRITPDTTPAGADAVDRILDSSAGKDLAGIYAAGAVHSGMATSTGVEHWYSGSTFNLDWSYYVGGDKAAKNGYAGTTWDDDAFADKVAWSERQLEVLARPAIDLEPGRYRAFLAPAAMQELFDILSWGGFGLKAQRTKSSPFLRMLTDGATLHPEVTLREDIAQGTAPAFQEQGFARPDEVLLVRDGSLVDPLVSPRSAQEYDVATNGATDYEAPVALSMAPGVIPGAKVLDELDTGIYVGNLWYLNFSDRAACRTTGMTRFATFWVADGEIKAPINVLRYDDTAYHLLGDKLVGLTDEAELLLDPSTYDQRSTASSRLPGAVISEMTFTL